MKSRAPLMMMEQMVMLLVFALASALCLQAFVKSDDLSQRSVARDQAVKLVQNVAETARSRGGDMGEALSWTAELLDCNYEQGLLWQDLGEDWQPAQGAGVYRLRAQGVPSDVPGLNVLQISVFTGGGVNEEEADTLFEIEAAWQMEGGNG